MSGKSRGLSARASNKTPVAMAGVIFDTARLISEVQKFPAIYDVSSEDYQDKSTKAEAWLQICQILVPKWRSLSDDVRSVEGRILRSKWRNIRDYFMKELKAQKLQENPSGGKKRKKYMYFEQLQFLLNNTQQSTSKKTGRSKHQIQAKHEEVDLDEDPLQTTSLLEEQYDIPLSHDSLAEDYPNDDMNNVDVVTANDPMYSQFPKSICETSMTSTTEDYSNSVSINAAVTNKSSVVDEDDYEKMFLLSLLPMMRRIPEDQKLDVRIQMQQIIAQALKANTP